MQRLLAVISMFFVLLLSAVGTVGAQETTPPAVQLRAENVQVGDAAPIESSGMLTFAGLAELIGDDTVLSYAQGGVATLASPLVLSGATLMTGGATELLLGPNAAITVGRGSSLELRGIAVVGSSDVSDVATITVEAGGDLFVRNADLMELGSETVPALVAEAGSVITFMDSSLHDSGDLVIDSEAVVDTATLVVSDPLGVVPTVGAGETAPEGTPTPGSETNAADGRGNLLPLLALIGAVALIGGFALWRVRSNGRIWNTADANEALDSIDHLVPEGATASLSTSQHDRDPVGGSGGDASAEPDRGVSSEALPAPGSAPEPETEHETKYETDYEPVPPWQNMLAAPLVGASALAGEASGFALEASIDDTDFDAVPVDHLDNILEFPGRTG